jgi:hypothetical protein
VVKRISLAVYEKSDTVQAKWSFAQYVSPTGRKTISDWRAAMAPGPFKAEMDTFLRLMAKTQVWTPPQLGALKGNPYRGLTELRWRSGNIQHRLVGYYTSPGKYLLLIGCTHKDRRYDPPDALDTAADRRAKVLSGEASTSEFALITSY